MSARPARRPAPARPAAAHSCGGAGHGRRLGAAPARRLPPGLGACERGRAVQGGGGAASAMRWPRGPRGAWRLLPRRSLLAALFLFSLSSSFLYFVYVAPGIGKRRAGAGGGRAGTRCLPLETLSNPRPAGPGAAASPRGAARARRSGCAARGWAARPRRSRCPGAGPEAPPVRVPGSRGAPAPLPALPGPDRGQRARSCPPRSLFRSSGVLSKCL